MAEKVTTMVLKVDLQCSSCYKKIKKILCKFPQIRDQIYDEKQNTVTIVVVCCSPEKVRDKLYCKGGKTIKCIKIKEPSKPPKEPEKPPKEPSKPPKEPEKPPKEPEKPPKELEKPPQEPAKPPKEPVKPPKEPEKPPKEPVKPPKEPEKPPKEPVKPPKEPEKPPKNPKEPPPCLPAFVPVCYPPMYPVGTCCGQCYEGRTDGPCYHGHGRPVPPYDNYGYGPSSYVGHRDYYTSQCDYFSEENTSGCTIM
ncbi:Heavy metal-associated isoprenylated plant protein 6 [Camellia lanceoleosa]|uniref:Heavy metal-associated isoprenylated plant protein 6 n=1 Tax=Camellia lanceoleosa TaxID=1840588 RepID=A0ACC0G452_9ERIC|nr:Heavy metal-associated isoprenylated plant protein 6 [Camellia lanceoleosa]